MPVAPKVERTLAAALHRAGLSNHNATLVVGVSGGADSTALLYGLNNLRERCGIRLHVAHLNHDFRGEEADEDARFVESLAHELGLPVSVEKRDPIAYQQERRISSFEQGAREMRYDFLARVASEVQAPAVAVGHTSDDLAETVLLHILRGTGLPGLRGMAETSPWPWPAGLTTPVLFRPLLDISKSETEEYCRELGRSFRSDSGNSLFRFTRNRVRRELMPLLASEFNPRIREALVRLAHTSSQELAFLEEHLEASWNDLVSGRRQVPSDGAGPASIALDRPGLAALHPALRHMALRRAYTEVNGDPRRLRENHLHAMSDMVESGLSEGSLDLPAGLRFSVNGNRATLAGGGQEEDAHYPELGEEFAIEVPTESAPHRVYRAGEWQVTLTLTSRVTLSSVQNYFEHRALLVLEGKENVITLRNRQNGDRFQPLGMTGTKKLKDFLGDANVPRWRRDKVPLLVTERGIAWVVGYRIAEWAKVPDDCPPDTALLVGSFEPADSAAES